MVVPTCTKINIGFGLALTFLAVVSVFTYRETLRSMQAVRWVEHTHVTQEEQRTLLIERTAKSQESAWRTVKIAAVGSSLALLTILVTLLIFNISVSKRQHAENATALKEPADDSLLSRSTIFDITERKRAEETLRESEEKYRALIETTGTGYVIMDTQGRVVDANAEYVWLAGHRALQEILGRRVTEWTAPHDRARNAEAVRRCAELGFVRDLEIEYVDGEGKCTPVEVDATIVPAAGGVRIVGLCRDISERKRVQQALQESEERYRDLAENAAELIQSVSQEGQFLYVNRAWRETLGYSMEEVTRIKLGNVIAPELLPQCQEVFAKVRRGEAANDVETVFVAKTGKRVAVRGSVSCRLVDGKHDVTNGIFRDITARLEIEKMKDEFVSTVSHELRTPLTSIRGALGLLTAGVLNAEPAKARRMLEIAVANTDRLIRLINDILDIERIESGRVKLEKRSCPTASLMVQAMNSVREVADRAGVKLELFPISTSVLADPDRVVQALTNLLGNAIKFSPSSSTVTLRATPQQSEMLFEVKDQGRGIPADKLGVIFERFQQVDASDGREKGGTGLGLAICRSIVDQHGGRIWAESELGKGSSFYFTLPLLKEEEFLQQNLKTE